MYVVLLGLDVLGNPFGLVVGVARSVEDLFYEPFQVSSSFWSYNFDLVLQSLAPTSLVQGAVEGPSEFAEGLAIGVRSVFSGVVGGGASTTSTPVTTPTTSTAPTAPTTSTAPTSPTPPTHAILPTPAIPPVIPQEEPAL